MNWTKVFTILRYAGYALLFIFLLMIYGRTLQISRNEVEYRTDLCQYLSCNFTGLEECSCSPDYCELCYSYNITFQLTLKDPETQKNTTYFQSQIISYPGPRQVCSLNGTVIFANFTNCFYSHNSLPESLSLETPERKIEMNLILGLAIASLVLILFEIGIIIGKLLIYYRNRSLYGGIV